MGGDIQSKARALKDSLGAQPWLQTVGVGELGGEPVIFVYAKGRVPFSLVPDIWRGVKVWVRRVSDDDGMG